MTLFGAPAATVMLMAGMIILGRAGRMKALGRSCLSTKMTGNKRIKYRKSRYNKEEEL